MPVPHYTKRAAALRALVASLLGPNPRHVARRRMAALLRQLADELDRPRPPYRSGSAPPGYGVRWNGYDLLIGRGLWRALGQPRRVHFAFSGSITRIVPDEDGDFLIRTPGTNMPRITCRRAWHLGQWAEGWRPGVIDKGAIVFDGEAVRL